MAIEIVKDDIFGWSVYFDGEILLECLTYEEVESLTIREIKALANQYL